MKMSRPLKLHKPACHPSQAKPSYPTLGIQTLGVESMRSREWLLGRT